MRKALHNSIRLCLLLTLAVTTGCHHRPKQVYVAPPTRHYDTGNNVSWGYHAHTSKATPVAKAPATDEPAQSSISGKPQSVEVGMSSWYGPPYNHQRGANGEIYDQNAMTAAHRTLPMGTIVRVTNVATGQSAVVKITDRGPFIHGRVLDLSLAAAKATGVYRAGVAKVKIEVFSQPPTSASGKWCVQVGAFSNEGNANKLKNDLVRRYSSAKVIEFPGPTGHWVRVNTTTGDRTKASQIADSIRPNEPNAEAYLVRLD